METPSGWISYTNGPGGQDHLPPEARAEVERAEAERRRRRGRLLCEVHGSVYEHDTEDAEMYVSFPDDALLSLESDRGQIAAAVARASSSAGGGR
jgi:hypothetical protein